MIAILIRLAALAVVVAYVRTTWGSDYWNGLMAGLLLYLSGTYLGEIMWPRKRKELE